MEFSTRITRILTDFLFQHPLIVKSVQIRFICFIRVHDYFGTPSHPHPPRPKNIRPSSSKANGLGAFSAGQRPASG